MYIYAFSRFTQAWGRAATLVVQGCRRVAATPVIRAYPHTTYPYAADDLFIIVPEFSEPGRSDLFNSINLSPCARREERDIQIGFSF